MADNVIPIEGCFNFRDLGGYRCTSGRRVRAGLLYRSDGLHALTDAGKQALAGLQLRSVVDLRRPSESNEKPDILPEGSSVRYLSIPLFEAADPEQIRARGRRPLSEIYLSALVDAKRSLARIINALASADTLPAVIHCTAGKDRTGIVAAMVLDLLLVSREEIAHDYAMSESFLEPLYPEYRRRARQEALDRTEFEERLRSRPETILSMLQKVDREYGTTEAYFLDAGVGAQTVDRLRKQLTE